MMKQLLLGLIVCLLFLAFALAANDPSEKDGEEIITGDDPPEIVGKALICFDHVERCDPKHRLGPSGNLNVSKGETDAYCKGGCYQETMDILTCIQDIVSNFEFYNQATIDDVRDTIKQACSNSSKRGDFDVAERLSSSGSQASHSRFAVFFFKSALPVISSVLLVMGLKPLAFL